MDRKTMPHHNHGNKIKKMFEHYRKSFTSIYNIVCGDLLKAVAINSQSKKRTSYLLQLSWNIYLNFTKPVI
jgi:Mor family transcriptional regulator